MAIIAGKDGKLCFSFTLPFRKSSPSSFNGSSLEHRQPHSQRQRQVQILSCASVVSSLARSLLPIPCPLKLDPAKKLYFPYEPGKQVRSAVKIKNTTKSHVAFKFQTTEPKSCFMRPPGAVLAPGNSLIATVFKFIEPPVNNEKRNQKSRVKFKITSIKVKGEQQYKPNLFEDLSNQRAKEQILQVVFLDAERRSPALKKLQRQLAEAAAAAEACKKLMEDASQKFIGEGLVADEWKERRERYLAQERIGSVESI
ncbi:unnamed protein product [Cuscuta europaea]|uniref:MSP domain-containing protein n=1 Tax=Cuscuta europaea TaxID=41803 RepID=A0A9P0ZR86_CUSEU|nr:unnamed protein product [Cuscuta europaea]